MITRIINGRVVDGGAVRTGASVYFGGGQILAVTEQELPHDAVLDAGGQYVSPGFIDMHTHGALGFDFCSASPREIALAADYHLAHGTTALLPTVTASSPEVTRCALDAIRQAMQEGKTRAHLCGAHLEGPYFSLRQAGAQDPACITAPLREDYTALCAAYPEVIRRWSYAPERDAGGEFCRYIAARGILPSAGHTDAVYEDMAAAREAGCRLITHLYSCTSTVTRDHGFRRLGVIECAYLWDDVDVEIIADGCHLPLELIRLIVKLKGVSRVSLVTDSLRVTGTEAQTSSVGSTACIIEDGVCKLPDRSAFAGSIATADRLVRVCVQAGIPLADAVRMASENPARLLGRNAGRLTPGADADILFFDDDIRVSRVIVSGVPVI